MSRISYHCFTVPSPTGRLLCRWVLVSKLAFHTFGGKHEVDSSRPPSSPVPLPRDQPRLDFSCWGWNRTNDHRDVSPISYHCYTQRCILPKSKRLTPPSPPSRFRLCKPSLFPVTAGLIPITYALLRCGIISRLPTRS